MTVCKCPHIRHINSCINVTYDVIFFTPDETGSAMMNSTHISLLKGMAKFRKVTKIRKLSHDHDVGMQFRVFR